jgi:hypothetical protein
MLVYLNYEIAHRFFTKAIRYIESLGTKSSTEYTLISPFSNRNRIIAQALLLLHQILFSDRKILAVKISTRSKYRSSSKQINVPASFLEIIHTKDTSHEGKRLTENEKKNLTQHHTL